MLHESEILDTIHCDAPAQPSKAGQGASRALPVQNRYCVLSPEDDDEDVVPAVRVKGTCVSVKPPVAVQARVRRIGAYRAKCSARLLAGRRACVDQEIHTLVIHVRGEEKRVCSRWMKRCQVNPKLLVGDPALRRSLTCTHKRRDPARPHLDVPLCYLHETVSCPHSNCRYLHRDGVERASVDGEGKAAEVESGRKEQQQGPRVVTSRPKTALCLKHTAFVMGIQRVDCDNGAGCSNGHCLEDCVPRREVAALNALLVPGGGSLPLQSMFEAAHACLTAHWDYINDLRAFDGQARLARCPEAIPSNFREVMSLWMSSAGLARRCGGENRLPLFPALGDGCEEEALAYAFVHRLYVCRVDEACEVERLVRGSGSRLRLSEVCVHVVYNCKLGAHVSEVVDGSLLQVCGEELTRGSCSCEYKSSAAAAAARSALSSRLSHLKEELRAVKARRVDAGMGGDAAAGVASDSKRLSNDIARVGAQLARTYAKVHLVSGLGWRALVPVRSQGVPELPTDVDASVGFASLPSLSHEELAARAESASGAREAMLASAAAAARTRFCVRLRAWARQLRDVWSVRATGLFNAAELARLTSDALPYMSAEECVSAAGSEMLARWFSDTQCLTLPQFMSDVRRKQDVWDSMGCIVKSEVCEVKGGQDTRRRRQGKHGVRAGECVSDVVVVPSEREEYASFWSWYYGRRACVDPAVVGDAADVVATSPELFEEYMREVTGFSVRFDVWLSRKCEGRASVASPALWSSFLSSSPSNSLCDGSGFGEWLERELSCAGPCVDEYMSLVSAYSCSGGGAYKLAGVTLGQWADAFQKR